MHPLDAKALIKKLSPFMEEDSEVFRELVSFLGQGAKVDVHHGDLSKFLGHRRLYRVIRLKGESYKDCVYQLVDNYPESMDALGMLRYYKAPAGPVRWEEVEAAEIALKTAAMHPVQRQTRGFVSPPNIRSRRHWCDACIQPHGTVPDTLQCVPRRHPCVRFRGIVPSTTGNARSLP